jgi:hypothetical protein
LCAPLDIGRPYPMTAVGWKNLAVNELNSPPPVDRPNLQSTCLIGRGAENSVCFLMQVRLFVDWKAVAVGGLVRLS